MPMWRCPHCGTPQAETARCWVCRRSSTACGTCRNFRRSVAGSLGYCGLDRRRQPLAGDEIRECWEAGVGAADPSLAAATRTVGDEGPASRHAAPSEFAAPIEFIEVHGLLASETDLPDLEPAAPGPGPRPPSSDPSPFVPPPGGPAGEPGWSLWGDLDR